MIGHCCHFSAGSRGGMGIGVDVNTAVRFCISTYVASGVDICVSLAGIGVGNTSTVGVESDLGSCVGIEVIGGACGAAVDVGIEESMTVGMVHAERKIKRKQMNLQAIFI